MGFRLPETKLVTINAASAIAERLRAEGKRLVTTNGCFDLFHLGHVRSLTEARALGDVLFCGVNSDASVRRLKGPTRPVWDENTRALQLASLEAVDYVVVFGEDTPERFLRAVRAQVHAKGADYVGKQIPEQAIVSEWNGRIEYIPLVEGYSTTSLIHRLKLLGEE